MQIILAHGWAYTPSIFEPWLLLHPETQPTPRILALNQGYFEPSTHAHWQAWQPHTQTWTNTQAPDPQTPCIGIGHSLGLSKLLAQPFTWQTLISINGFTQFPQSLALRQMIRKAKTDLRNLIPMFHQQCSAPMPPHTEALNASALQTDLESLHTLDCSTALSQTVAQNTRIIHIATKQDSIIAPQHSTACFATHPPQLLQSIEQEGPHADLYTTPTRYTWLIDFLSRSAPH
jgi:hypothetical protein